MLNVTDFKFKALCENVKHIDRCIEAQLLKYYAVVDNNF